MKRFTAMLCAVVMMIAAVAPVTSFAAFSDVDDNNRYKEAITALSTLSVIDGYEDGTFKPDGAITRAEFTKLIVFMLGLQSIEYTSYTFEDVDPTHWARNFIQTGYDRGIIAGFDDGTFKSEEPVTYAQALKMVVCTLGYEQMAMLRTPTGDDWANLYIQQANDLGLTKNVANQAQYEGASRAVVAQVLYNALEIDMYENNGYSWVQTEKTLMNDYLKVKKLKGTLVGVDDYLTEKCTVDLPEQYMDILNNSGEQILIDYSQFTDKVTDINKYLGSTITVYYRQLSDNDDRILINIDADSTKNTAIEIKYDDLSSYEGNTLKYFDTNSKSKSLKINPNELTVNYNGKLVTANDTVDINGETYSRQEALTQWLSANTGNTIYGSVKLTDDSSDNTYDMIEIYDYDVIMALSAPTTTDYRLSDKLVTGNYLLLDPQSSYYKYTITRNGEGIEVTSIAANDVVLYAESLDYSLKTLIVSNKTVKGTVSSLSTDKGTMSIGGTSYNISPTLEKYIKDKSNRDLKNGVSGTFYLDALDTVVFGTLDEATVSPYAYITNAYLDTDEGGKPYITVYAPTVNTSETASYKLKSTVKLNGSSTKAETAIDKIQAAADYSGNDRERELATDIYGAGKTPANTQYAQPARVTISNKEVTDIVLLESGDVSSQNEDKEKIVKGKELDKYNFSNNSFTKNGSTAFSVNSSTTVLYVPMDRSQKKQYAKKTVSSAFTSGEQYYVEAYDMNSSRIAGLVILYGADGTLTKVKKDTDFSIAVKAPDDSYSDKLDKSVQEIQVFSGTNTPKTWLTYSPTEFSDIKAGDVFQFAYDSDNLIQGRINNIRYDDIASVLDGEMYDDQFFNWEETLTPDEDNNYQTMKFDYRFKNADTHQDETYTSSTLGTVPNSRVAVFNISQVLTDEKKLYVTKGGFSILDPTAVVDEENYEEVSITSSTKIIRMEDDRKEVSRYVDNTTTDLSINDLRDAKNYGADCSKVLIAFSKGNAKLIMILK